MIRYRSLFIVGAVACVHVVAWASEEQTWEIQGEYVSLKSESPGVVVLRTPGGLVEVPLEALSESGRAEVEKRAGRPSGVAVRPAVGAEEVPKALVEDLAACVIAAEASDLCTLALADGSLSPVVLRAIEQQRTEFESRASRGEIRFGKAWASPEVVREANARASRHLTAATEMMRLGNLTIVNEELRKASQADPSSGQADFVMGLAFLVRNRPDYEEAQAFFEEVIRRQPTNGPAWNNLGVCKARKRDYPEALEAFRAAGRDASSRGAAAVNLGTLITAAADRRSRISTRELDGIRALYQELSQGQEAGAAAVGGPVVLSPAGAPVAVGGMLDLTSLLAPPPTVVSSESPDLVGVVVATDTVLCSLPKHVRSVSDGLVLALNDGRNLPAERIATAADGGFLLLSCPGLGIAPLPLAMGSPKPGISVTVVDPTLGPAASAAGSTVTAKILTASTKSTDRPRFVVDVENAADPNAAGQGALMLDAAGRLAGLGASQPPANATRGSKRLAIPVDMVWGLLKQLDEPIRPQGGQEPVIEMAVVEAVSRCQASLVRVRTGQPIVKKP